MHLRRAFSNLLLQQQLQRTNGLRCGDTMTWRHCDEEKQLLKKSSATVLMRMLLVVGTLTKSKIILKA
jgi:uncharacterized protein YqkB